MLKEIYYLIRDKNLFYFSLSSGISTFAYSLLVYYYPIIMTFLGLNTFTIGLIYSVTSLIYVILNLPLSG